MLSSLRIFFFNFHLAKEKNGVALNGAHDVDAKRKEEKVARENG
jgi:hypothetical protein